MNSPSAKRRGRTRSRSTVPTTKTLDRGLMLLEALATAPHMSLSDLARAADLSPSTTFRIVETLKQRRFVAQSEETGHLSLGLKLFELGAAAMAPLTLPELSHPVMSRLVATLNETVNLAILEDGRALYIHQVQGQQTVRMFTRLGARESLYCTGAGKVLMAWLPDDQRRKLIDAQDFTPFTPKSITSRRALIEALAKVRKQGYALDDEEREPGVRCIAAPVRDRLGQVIASVSVSAPSDRFTKLAIRNRVSTIVDAADEITRRCGYLSGTAGGE